MPENLPVSEKTREVSPEARRFRRLITGLNEEGRSTVLIDEASPHRQVIADVPSFVMTQFWRHDRVPVDNSGPIEDGLDSRVSVAPPLGGSAFRVLAFPPDSEWETDADATARMFHSTPSLDYAIVLDGEIWAVMDDGEFQMGPGDVLIQRGTNHHWSNRTDKPVHVFFVLIGGSEQ